MVKIAIMSPNNAKLVVDNPLVLAEFGDESFTNNTLTMKGLISHAQVCWSPLSLQGAYVNKCCRHSRQNTHFYFFMKFCQNLHLNI